MFDVFVRTVEDFEVPASLTGQGIHDPFTGDERSEGHETRHNRRQHLQFLLQPPEKAEAHFLTRCIKGGGTRTKLPVRVHKQWMRSIDLCAGRGLCPVQTATRATVVCLRLRNELDGEIGLRARKLGLGTRGLGLHVGLVRILFFCRQLAAEVLLFSLRSRRFLLQFVGLVLRG
jgi:hypothetical protein